MVLHRPLYVFIYVLCTDHCHAGRGWHCDRVHIHIHPHLHPPTYTSTHIHPTPSIRTMPWHSTPVGIQGIQGLQGLQGMARYAQHPLTVQ